jgi:signal transduction histidine kinase
MDNTPPRGPWRAGRFIAGGWRALGAWGRISLVGLAAAGLLAVSLGLYLPRRVERHLLHSELEFDRMGLAALLSERALPGDESSRDDLDRFVRAAVLRGDYVRVKLWSPEGRIVYSDEPRLVGRSFPPEESLRRALGGETRQEVTDLSAPENIFERPLARRLLEVYLPVERGGQVVGAWEVYRSLDRVDAALGKVRRAVWLSVGGGLGVLVVFLLSSFGSLLRSLQEKRAEAERRSADLAVLLDVSRAVAGSLDVDALAGAAVRTVAQRGDLRGVALVRRAPAAGHPAQVVASSSRAGCSGACLVGAAPGVEVHDGRCVTLAVELAGSGGLLLVACRAVEEGFTGEEQELLAAAGEQVAVALENARLYETLRAAEEERRGLTARLVSAHEDERRRIVGEIHDGLGQDLHRVLFGLRGCRSSPAEETAEELSRLEQVVDESSRRLRRLLQELRPSTLDDVGLAASLRGLAHRLRDEDGLDVAIRSADLAEPPVAVRVAVFRIVQEALRNVAKHAGTTKAVVDLDVHGGTLLVQVADRGQGRPAQESDRLGVWLMRERAEALGGSLSIESGPGGTTVVARIPLVAGVPA